MSQYNDIFFDLPYFYVSNSDLSQFNFAQAEGLSPTDS